ncbi:mpv17-like protein 2 [Bicyclus anynana]|uniref:Mpv17-like protein 2 n=1 Tax=Bicyclus anynana TaxID=110368 RepID=A0A6J1NHL8_BICAN|nr:mpv17-like protein 2 [Bicyclus anynana]XP_023946458.1 mpv17-like protein 2 [Bicyclus anynana]
MQHIAVTWRRLSSHVRTSAAFSRFQGVVKVAFSDKYLLYTNITISLTLSSVGDGMEQMYELYTGDLKEYNPQRTMQMAFSGIGVGILCHHWYKVLDRFIIGKSFDMVVKKLMLDQLIFSPIMIITFFGSLALLEKDPWTNFQDEVKDKFTTLYKAEWMVWPPAQIINFYFLPTRYRVLYDNTISLGYDVYTSQVKHNKSLKTVTKDVMS